MPELKTSQQRQEQTKSNRKVLSDFLGSAHFKQQLARVLPKQLDSERFHMVAFRQLNAVAHLDECDLMSVAGSIMQAGILGLEIATMGESWLVPYEIHKGKPDAHYEAQLMIGYLGHLALAWRSDQVAGLQVDAVMKGDEFEFQRGTKGFILHKPKRGRVLDSANLEYAYAVVETIHGGFVWQVLDRDAIERIRKRAPSKDSPAWRDWYPEMAQGKALRATLKMCPKSRELARAVALDEQADAGLQQTFDVDAITIPAQATRTASPENEEVLRKAAEGEQERAESAKTASGARQEAQTGGEQERQPEPVAAQRPAQEQPQERTMETPEKPGTLGW